MQIAEIVWLSGRMHEAYRSQAPDKCPGGRAAASVRIGEDEPDEISSDEMLPRKVTHTILISRGSKKYEEVYGFDETDKSSSSYGAEIPHIRHFTAIQKQFASLKIRQSRPGGTVIDEAKTADYIATTGFSTLSIKTRR